MEILIAEKIETPLGTLLAAASSQGLCLLEFTDVEDRINRHVAQLEKSFNAQIKEGNSKIIQQLKKELTEYFNGNRKTFDIALYFRGTEFQEKA